MITEFHIKGYKKFDNLFLRDLSGVNLILGNNNAGKTTILEAIYAFTCGSNIPQMLSTSSRIQLSSRNAYEFMEKILNLFNERNKLPLEFCFEADFDNMLPASFCNRFSPSSIFADLEPSLMCHFGASQNDR